MKTHFALAITAALCFGAHAADLPVKAPVQNLSNLLSPYSGSGLYVGLNTGGGGGNANLSQANVVALQGLAGITVGYAWALPSQQSFAAIEADVDMMNLSTGATAGLTLNGPVDIDVRALYGFPWQTVGQYLPVFGNLFTNNPLPPFNALPAGVTATNTHFYIFAGFDVKDVSLNVGLASNKEWLIAPQVGFGQREQLSSGFALDTSMAIQFDEKGLCVGAAPVGQTGCGNLGLAFIGKLKLLH